MQNPAPRKESNMGIYTTAQSPSGIPPEAITLKRFGSGKRVTNVERPLFTSASASTMSQPERELLWKLMGKYLGDDVKTIQEQIVRHVEYTLARTRYNFDDYAAYQATALSVRDRLIESWNDTQQFFTEQEVKRVYYLSLEFLMGRTLQNAVQNLGMTGPYAEALKQLGHSLENIIEQEKDAALGNGGLGRLAACFMDSLATMDYPAWGYGIRYSYGMFQQQIIDGYQAEFPDYWLTFGNPWEIERLDVFYPIQFFGRVSEYTDNKNRRRYRWEGGETVFAVAYDTPIPGYNTFNTINIRLWSSKPSKEFDFSYFNQGDYFKAIEDKQRSENITSVLYPNDSTYTGKELRLKQQYFFAAATLRDIIRRFKKTGRPFSEFPDMVAIQLNDTHPTISIPELMRLLVDEEGLDWDEAWDIVTRTFAYTNHTVLPEALETWTVEMIDRLLPRHMKIIYDINWHFLKEVQKHWPQDDERLSRMSIIQEGWPKKVRMANLAIVGSHSTNGVAAIHSEILKETIFKDFFEMTPEKFNNKTNGVTPRRWLLACNPSLAKVLNTWLDTEEWVTKMDTLTELRSLANNPDLKKQWRESKQLNKERFAKYIQKRLGITVNTNALFDVHIKRIHEYKRQLLNILSVIARYDALKKMTSEQRAKSVPRVVFFAGKAAAGYFMAKRVIKLINSVADVCNRDHETNEYLKVVFVPNYNVSVAEIMIPASDLSQHISTAGTEASGTSNMKFAMNGCLIIGTLDGANVEIRDQIGEENTFIFGVTADKVNEARAAVNSGNFTPDPRLQRVFEMLRDGVFGSPEIFQPIIDTLAPSNDYYLLTYDFASYMDAQDRVDEAYKNQDRWTKMSILSTAGSGTFSSDRTIKQYAEQIWNIKPCARPDPKQGKLVTKSGDSSM